MKSKRIIIGGLSTLLVGTGLSIFALSGCAGDVNSSSSVGTGSVAIDHAELVQEDDSASQKSGSELWADNCMRCHNYRSPDSLSDAQWEVAMLHMRSQARLTADEGRAILQFLKAAN